MDATAVYLFDVGPPQKLPGFDEEYHFSLLPFWGNHCLADFMLANFTSLKEAAVTIVLEDSSRNAALALATRWKKQSVRVHALEKGLPELARLVAASEAQHVVLAALSSISVIDPDAVLALVAGAGNQVVKASVARTPIEIYCGRREHVAQLLGSTAGRRNPRQERGAMNPRQERGAVDAAPPLREALFDGLLHSAIDLIEDLPGELLFQNDLMEYYGSNMWVVENCGTERYQRIVARLPELSDRGAESHIAEKGLVRSSWLSSGVEVEGTVEDSIIFPNVSIRRNTLVSRSVILNGNRIGTGSEIHNALILPFTAEVPRSSPNIGDKCAIGARSSTMKNAAFPGQIRDGIAVIGTNAEIPNGFRAEAASYVAPGVDGLVLRRLKLLRRGASVLDDHGAAPGRRAVPSEDKR